MKITYKENGVEINKEVADVVLELNGVELGIVDTGGWFQITKSKPNPNLTLELVAKNSIRIKH